MKNSFFQARAALVAVALIALPTGIVVAADDSTVVPTAPTLQAEAQVQISAAPTTAPAPAPAPAVAPAPVKVPYGVEEVLKLNSAQVNESVIVTYIQNSGKFYTLKSDDIVYLRSQGVSDNVIAAMLTSKANVMAASQAAQAQTQVVAAAPAQQTTVTYVQQPVYEQPAPAVVETAPASTVYVIPSPAAQAANYGRPSSYPYGYGYGYYGYGGYYAPSISLGFRVGGYGGYGYWGNRCYTGRTYCRR